VTGHGPATSAQSIYPSARSSNPAWLAYDFYIRQPAGAQEQFKPGAHSPSIDEHFCHGLSQLMRENLEDLMKLHEELGSAHDAGCHRIGRSW
jgi:hypothetical protein